MQAISDWMLGLGWNQKVTRDHASTCKKRKKSFYNSRDTELLLGYRSLIPSLVTVMQSAGEASWTSTRSGGPESDPTMIAVQGRSHN